MLVEISLCILNYFLKWPDVFSFYVKIVAVNAKGLSSPVNIKTSTVKETSRLPLLPPEQSMYYVLSSESPSQSPEAKSKDQIKVESLNPTH